MKPEHQSRMRTDVTQRILDSIDGGDDDSKRLQVLEDTLYFERLRLERKRLTKRDPDVKFYQQLGHGLHHASSAGQLDMLRSVIHRFLDEIMGHFEPKMYEWATRLAPSAMAGLLNSWETTGQQPKTGAGSPPQPPHQGRSRDRTQIVRARHLGGGANPCVQLGLYRAGVRRLSYGHAATHLRGGIKPV